MKKGFIFSTLLFAALSMKAHAAYVVWPAVSFGSSGDLYGMSCDLAAEIGGLANVSYEAQQNLPSQLTLTALSATIAIGQFWFETSFGSPIDMTATSQAIPFAHNFPDSYGEWTPVDLHLNQIFYFGFWLDADWSGTPSDTTDLYGWAALLWDGTELTLVDSAAETTGVGIYAGTYNAIPEPASAGLLLAGVAAALLRRRRPPRLQGGGA